MDALPGSCGEILTPTASNNAVETKTEVSKSQEPYVRMRWWWPDLIKNFSRWKPAPKPKCKPVCENARLAGGLL